MDHIPRTKIKAELLQVPDRYDYDAMLVGALVVIGELAYAIKETTNRDPAEPVKMIGDLLVCIGNLSVDVTVLLAESNVIPGLGIEKLHNSSLEIVKTGEAMIAL